MFHMLQTYIETNIGFQDNFFMKFIYCWNGCVKNESFSWKIHSANIIYQFVER